MATDGRFLVLGTDPGPTRVGWAVIEAGPRLPYRFVAGGMVESEPIERVWDVITDYQNKGTGDLVVAVERPAGYIHEHARGAQLLATAGVAGKISAFATMHGLPLFEASAAEWRRAIVGRANANDSLVKQALLRYGFSSLNRTRTSSHVRDAIGIATCAALNRGKRK